MVQNKLVAFSRQEVQQSLQWGRGSPYIHLLLQAKATDPNLTTVLPGLLLLLLLLLMFKVGLFGLKQMRLMQPCSM